ncbi:TonB-dependent receptor [Aliiglaciecola sp. LCG003]|uniref:TonB-dependent receptor n=1 Tax=Aliiglaciecola sp. LCG003 TaxID=3053655 RepID=UPI0025724F5F|nr:TonB-dependent receptor [Aliiglaciecola sp. LCG003]WJG08970.1 TonB-dependent receptor [Aliiglaciecola sp. LCG003]
MRTQFKKKTNLIAAAIIGCTVGVIQVASANVGDSSLKGHVSLAGQSANEGVNITIINVDNGNKINATTNQNGNYTLTGLKPGNYKIQIGDSNRQSEVFNIQVGQSKVMDLDDSVTSTNAQDIEVISVVANFNNFDVSSEVGTGVSAIQIERLPQINRNFLAFADQAPGVNLSVSQADGSVSVTSGAQTASAVNVFIDGIGQKDYVLKSGISGQDSSRGNPFPQTAIGEYRIISSNYKAEFDQVSSAAITAVTKSGTNELHGGVFYDYTDSGMREKTPIEEMSGDKADSKQEQFGFWLSGPIIEDKLHYFATYERKQNDDLREIRVNRQDLIDNYPQFLQDAIAQNVGATTAKFEEDLFFAKLDWNIDDDQNLSASVKYRDEVEVTGIGGENTQEYGTDKENDDLRFTVNHQYWGDSWSNNLAFTYEDAVWSPHARTSGAGARYFIGTNDQISGSIINLGAGPDFQEKGQKGWSIKEDLTLTDIIWNGEHTIKMGFKYKAVELTAIEKNPANPQVYYVLDATDITEDSTTIMAAVPYKVEYGQALDSIGNGAAVSKNKQLGFYIQDDWAVTDRLELNIGLRLSFEDSPLYTDYRTPDDVVDAVTNWSNIENADYEISDYISTGNERSSNDAQWEPRIGFSYLLTEDSMHLLFGGYGRSYDRNRFDNLQLETTKGTFPKRTVYFSGDHSQPCNAPCIPFSEDFLTTLDQPTATGSREVFMLNNNLKQPYADQYSIGVRSTFEDFSTEVGFTRVETRDGFMYQIGNRRADGTFFAPGTTWGVPWGDDIPGDGLSHLLLGNNGLESDRDSVHFKLNKEHTRNSNWGGALTYTYTDATENRQYGEIFSLDYPTIDGFGTNASAGVSDHVLVASLTYDLPWQINFATKVTLKSAAPFYGTDCRAGWSDCKYSIGYQQEKSFAIGKWAYRQIDLSLSKDFNLGDGAMYVRLDVLNLLNTRNYGVSDNWFGGAGEELPANNGAHNGVIVGPTRTLKLSVGYNF